ncbi:hypothetical protein [Staphylococcus aureus]
MPTTFGGEPLKYNYITL